MTTGDEHGFARRAHGEGRWLAGVAGGLADRWDLPVSVLRAAFAVGALAFGAGAILYAALALAMPQRGADAAHVARSTELGRTLLVAARFVGAFLVVALLAALGAVLALFGLGAVALLVASACVLALVLAPSARPAPLAGAALALTLPAAAVALGDTQVARQFGARTVELRTSGDVVAAGYRTGTGPLLLDLRRFRAAPGTTTTIRARSDLRSLVVALPRTRCFSLVVDQTLDRGWPARVLDLRRPAALPLGPPQRVPAAGERRRAAAGQPASLVAFGKPILGTSVRFERTLPVPAGRPAPPRLHLILTTGRSQAVVRDYPDDARPLADPWWPQPKVPGAPRFGIARRTPAAATVPDDPRVPALLAAVTRRLRLGTDPASTTAQLVADVQRTIAGVQPVSRRHALERFARQEVLLREAVRYGDTYAARFAGACSTEREVSAVHPTIPALAASGQAFAKLTARWQIVRRRWPAARSDLRLVTPAYSPMPLPSAATLVELR